MKTKHPPDTPVFVLGLGAQKAGTTWLHAYLDHFAQSDFGEIKEYHIWDGLYLNLDRSWDTRELKQPLRRRLRHLMQNLRGGPRDPFYIRRGFQQDPARYFDYFATLLAQDGIAMTGDITPAYCGLEASHLTTIRDEFHARGIALRTVFLMREPVERCLSAIRMFRQGGISREGVDISLSDAEALMAYIDSPNGRMRVDYSHTLTQVFEALDPEDVYIGAYENMFSGPEFDRLNQFFRLTAQPSFLDRKFNTTQQVAEIPIEMRHAAMRRLEPVYRDCFDRYPELRTLWPAGAALFAD